MLSLLSADDRLDIQDLTARYAWSLDTGDVEAFAACFLPEGVLRWETFERPVEWRGTAALRAFAGYFRGLPASAGRQHHVSNLRIAPADDGVRASAYVMVTWRRDDGPHPLIVLGYYEDLLRRDDGGTWRLARRVIRDWSGEVLARFAGQESPSPKRALPEALAPLFATGHWA